MELERFSVKELTTAEQVQINGGSKVGDFFARVWEGIVNVAEWIWENLEVTLKIEIVKGVEVNVSPK